MNHSSSAHHKFIWIISLNLLRWDALPPVEAQLCDLEPHMNVLPINHGHSHTASQECRACADCHSIPGEDFSRSKHEVLTFTLHYDGSCRMYISAVAPLLTAAHIPQTAEHMLITALCAHICLSSVCCVTLSGHLSSIYAALFLLG